MNELDKRTHKFSKAINIHKQFYLNQLNNTFIRRREQKNRKFKIMRDFRINLDNAYMIQKL